MIDAIHYKNFPCMQPWIGSKFNSSAKRVLFIGESHYLPKDSTIHLDPVIWYAATQSRLNKTEEGWINTAGIVSDAMSVDFRNKAYGIFRNIATELNNISPMYEKAKHVLNHISFYNFFQRPAIEGQSLEVKPLDKEVANSVFASIIGQLNPDGIVFTSHLAGQVASSLLLQKKILYVIAPHPTCQWWNRSAQKYGGITGRELVVNFLSFLPWKVDD